MTELHPIDLAIILAYVVSTVAIGFWISKRASKNLRSYFLGGNTIPWYLLGLSNASGMFDISGTMLMVYWLFVYGMKSVWIPWMWPVFNQIVLMVYLSVWLRRSGVVTGADWIRFRFGDGRGAQAAHLIVVLFALVNVVGFLAYGFIGIGKFAATFIPIALASDPATNASLWGLLITAITTVYVVKGGMFSVVFTEVLQFAFMTVACVGVGLIAMQQVTPEMIDAATPNGWRDLWFGWRLDLDWDGLVDQANAKISGDGWSLFSLFVGLALFKGALASMAGPPPNYDMQRVLSARTPREAALMSGVVSLVLLVPRYMLITGLTVLALAFFTDELDAMGGGIDFELILPFAMREFVPVGLFGLLVAALLAAFMSTYAATVNAAPAYVVNDIYKRYFNPEASDKTYVRLSYATSVVVVLAGTAFGFVIEELKDIVNWIVGALYGGYIAANLLKWHWWRFNGWGYFWGMASGIASALVIASVVQANPQLGGFETNLALFPVTLGVSLFGAVAGSLLTPPDDRAVLEAFYFRVRPWGWWGPIADAVRQEHPEAAPNGDLPRDIVNVAVGIAWQTALTAAGVYLVLQDYRSLAIALGVILTTSIILKFNWYDLLENYPSGVTDPEAAAS
ncbi:sodium:solute symporter family protein [Botrimarina sp.]|uniref:sodium:solute symporter family protein n=1 Tax=Botrimarina sp. TaxID=2795802 RepID=UPI0032EFF015